VNQKLEILFLPLDRARTALFVQASRVRVLRPLLLKKERRVPALLLGHAFVALLLALLAPSFLLVAGPLLLGVPHLVSDVRQLVLRPALPLLARPLFLGGSVLLLVARILEELHVPGMTRTELGLAAALALGGIAVAWRGARPARVLSATLVVLVLATTALLWPHQSRLLMAHGHNVMALLLWGALYARPLRAAPWVIGVVLSLAGMLVLSPLAWLGFQYGSQSAFGLHSLAAADTLAPGIRQAPMALGIVASFAFLQSVHYAVWLHAIPQAATSGEGTLSFRMSWRSLQRDLGPAALMAVSALVLLVPLAGLVEPLVTKSLYLSLSSFHGYLEVAAAALFFVRGAGPLAGPAAPSASAGLATPAHP
jgi:hypothetical protein